MTTELPRGDSQTEGPDPDRAVQIAALEQQLAQAQAELEEYQRLLNELPGIYEGKFRQKVRTVAQEIRQLLDERKALQEQVAHALAQPSVPEALPPASPPPSSPPPAPAAPPAPAVKTWADVRLPRFTPPSLTVPPFPALPSRRWLWGGVSGLVLLGVVAAGSWRLARRAPPQPTPTPGATRPVAVPAPLALQLQARGGESWVLVEDLKGRRVFDAILQPGARQTLPLGTGLRLRSGRPDLLFVAVGDRPPRPLGGVSDLQWVVMRP